MRELSSKITPYYRLLIPTFIFFCAAVVVSEFVPWSSLLDPAILFSTEGALAAGVVIFVLMNSCNVLQMKRIYLSDTSPPTLRIIGWWKAIEVPLADIDSVNEPPIQRLTNKRKNPYPFVHTLDLHFRVPTVFGNSVQFLVPPADHECPPPLSHPLVTELTLNIHNARPPALD